MGQHGTAKVNGAHKMNLGYCSGTSDLGNLDTLCCNGLQGNMPDIFPRERNYLYYSAQQMNIHSVPEGDITFIFQGFFATQTSQKYGLGIKLAVPWLTKHTGM